MPNKTLMLALAFGVAGLVLLLTVLIGGTGRQADDNKPTGPLNTDIYVPGDGAEDRPPLGEAEGIVYEVKEQGILFYANRIVPRAEGEIDAIDTTIQIDLSPDTELIIEADEGTIVAPEQHPQEGQMRGHVIVTLYESPDGSPIDTDTDQHVVMRMFFDDPVDFDLELQQIDSTGGVFLTGPQVQFLGRGLSMNYNQLKERIERLVIEEGTSLRYIPTPSAPAPGSAPAPRSASGSASESAPSSVAQASRSADSKSEADTSPAPPTPNPQSPTPDTDTPRQTQHYLATFEHLEDVRVGQDQYVIAGDTLSAIFSAGSADVIDADGSATAARNTRLPRTDPRTSLALASSDRLSDALAFALAASIGQLPEHDDPRSLATFTDEDVIITWHGRLTVTPAPEDVIPEHFGGPDDVMVTVLGSPATVRTDQDQSIRAPEVSFFKQSAGLLAKGTNLSPVSLKASDLGTLTGTELHIDQSRAVGHVMGPGKLTAIIKEDEQADPASETRYPNPDARPLSVSFHERLDLTFYRDEEHQPTDDSSALDQGGRVKGVKTADFIGFVEVDYDQLAMSAGRMTISLHEDAEQRAEQDDRMAVQSLEVFDVEAYVRDEDVRIIADRLTADPASNTIELFGSENTPARVRRPDALLTGMHMVMDDNADTVTVPGPGGFDYTHDLDKPNDTVHVTWTDRMHYDDVAGTARFQGDVKTKAIDATDTNELMGDDLLLTFVKSVFPEDKLNKAAADEAGQTEPVRRELAEAVMDGNVRFRARSYATPKLDPEELQTELYLVGPRMTFTDPTTSDGASDEAAQMVQITGKGRMLITDSRAPGSAPGSNQDTTNADGPASSIDFTGKGRTAFEWSDRLILDLTQGEMLMKGAVAMVHAPEDGGDRVQLDCHDLAAEMQPPGSNKKDGRKSTGGGAWLSDDAPAPELSRVWADGGVRILTGDLQVTSDHMLYEEAKREIILWSDDPNVVIYQAKGQPTPTRSSAFKWHRDTGRFEAFRLRTGTIPLRRSEREE